MPSLTDIPSHYLEPRQLHNFIAWLITVPIDWQTTHATILIWSRAVDRPLTTVDWDRIESQWKAYHAD